MPDCRGYPGAVQSLYKSTGYIDELAWAAAWLYKATGSQKYLTDARTYYAKVPPAPCPYRPTSDRV